MSAVARGAVRNRHIARFAFQSVIAVDKGLQASSWDTVLLIQTGRFVTGGACCLGNTARANRRARVAQRKNPVLAVAIRADRGISLSAQCQLTVNAFPIVLFNVSMAVAARLGDVEVIDRRFDMARRENPMRGAAS